MVKFPNYLMSSDDGHVPKKPTHADEIVLSRGFHSQQSERDKQKQEIKRETQEYRESIFTGSFKPTFVPTILKGLPVVEKVDYSLFKTALSKSDSQVILFEHAIAEQTTIESTTTHVNEKENHQKNHMAYFRKSAKRGGLHRSLNGIFQQEQTEVNYLSTVSKERK